MFSLGFGDDVYDGSLGTNNGLIDGGSGNDTIEGGAGADQIAGGSGDNVLTGNDGADLFIHSTGNSVITDFSPAEDTAQSVRRGSH